MSSHDFNCPVQLSLVETARLDRIEEELKHVNQKLVKLMATADEANAKLDAISANLTEIGSEVDTLLAKIDELIAAAQNNVPDTVMEKINAVKDQAQVVDDKVPNP